MVRVVLIKKENGRIPMFGTLTMSMGQRVLRDRFLEAIVVGAFILFAALATIDDLLLLFC